MATLQHDSKPQNGQPEKSQTRLVRSLRGGQITIPIEFRRALGIGPDTMLRITREGDELLIVPVQTTGPHRDATWFKELIEPVAPIRAEAVERGYTGDEINGWFDAAVAEVRVERRGRSQDR